MYSLGSDGNQIVTKWLRGILKGWSQSKFSAVLSAAERKAFVSAGSKVKLSEREPIQLGPNIALFPTTMVYQLESSRGDKSHNNLNRESLIKKLLAVA